MAALNGPKTIRTAIRFESGFKPDPDREDPGGTCFTRCDGCWSLEGDEAFPALETLHRNERWRLLFRHIQSPTLMNNN